MHGPVRVTRVAGVQTPAFVERVSIGHRGEAYIHVSPEFRLRPSLSARDMWHRNQLIRLCRRSSDSGLR